MKKLLSALFLFLFFCLPFAPTAHAKVYWIGRDIDMALQFGIHTKKDWRMFRLYGHSLLVIIPDNPAAFAKLCNPRRPQAYFTELEKDFGHGYKGFTLAAYAEGGTQLIGHADGYLQAHINAPREMESVRDFFAQTDNGKWNFAFGEVFSPYQDEFFALRLLRSAQYYIAYTRRRPLGYGTFNSAFEKYLKKRPNIAVNCNAFAYSLVRYAGGVKGPDLYSLRVMPGIANLLPASLFLPRPNQAKLSSWSLYTPLPYKRAIRRLHLQKAATRTIKNALQTKNLK